MASNAHRYSATRHRSQPGSAKRPLPNEGTDERTAPSPGPAGLADARRIRYLQQALGNAGFGRFVTESARSRQNTSQDGATQTPGDMLLNRVASPPGAPTKESGSRQPAAPDDKRGGEQTPAVGSEPREVAPRASRPKPARARPKPGAGATVKAKSQRGPGRSPPGNEAAARKKNMVEKTAEAKKAGPTRGFSSPQPASPATPAAQDIETDEPMALSDTPLEQPVSPLAGMPTSFRSAGLQSSANAIAQAADSEKTVMGAEMDARRAAFAELIEQTAGALDERAASEARGLARQAQARADDMDVAFTEGRAGVEADTVLQTETAVQESEDAVKVLDADVETQKAAALLRTETNALLLDSAGVVEAERARASSEEAAERVGETAAAEEGSANLDDSDVVDAVGGALGDLASDARRKLRNSGEDFASGAEQATEDAAAAVHRSGRDLVSAVDADAELARSGIVSSGAAIADAVKAAGGARSDQLAVARGEALASMTASEQSAMAELRGIGRKGAGKLRAIGAETLAQSKQDELAAGLLIDQAARSVIDRLAEMDASGAIDDATEAGFVEPAAATLSEGRLDLQKLLQRKLEESEMRLAEAEPAFAGALRGPVKAADDAFADMASTTGAGIGATVEEAKQQAETILAGGRDSEQKTVEGFSGVLHPGVEQALGSVDEQRAAVEEGVHEEVQKGVDDHSAVHDKAAGYMKDTVSGAEEQEESWIIGALRGLWNFVKGMLQSAVIQAIVCTAGAVLGFMLGGPLLAIFGSAVAFVAANAGLLLHAGYESVTRRIEEFKKAMPDDAPAWMYVASGLSIVVLLPFDVLRVTPLIEGIRGETLVSDRDLTTSERAERATEGLLSLGLMILLGRLGGRRAGAAGGVEGGLVEGGEASGARPVETPALPERSAGAMETVPGWSAVSAAISRLRTRFAGVQERIAGVPVEQEPALRSRASTLEAELTRLRERTGDAKTPSELRRVNEAVERANRQLTDLERAIEAGEKGLPPPAPNVESLPGIGTVNPNSLAVTRQPRWVRTASGEYVYDFGLEPRRGGGYPHEPSIGLQRPIFEWSSANIQRMLNGQPPAKVVLHHRNRQRWGPLDELTDTQHQKDSSLFHGDEAGEPVDRRTFDGERGRYWVSRVLEHLGM